MVLSLRSLELKGKVATDNISSFDSRDIMYNVKEDLDFVCVCVCEAIFLECMSFAVLLLEVL
jgi:hypothetical protein